MSVRDLVNGAGVVLALVLAVLVANPGSEPPPPANPAAAAPALDIRTLPDGRRALVDATGYPVPLNDYRRIVAGSTVARDLMLALAEPTRLAAVVDYGLDRHPLGHRFAGIPRLATVTEIEAVLPLAPDLVLFHHIRDPARVERLREAGLAVFDLGQMRGLRDLIPNIHQVATLLGAPERGAHLAQTFQRRMARIDADVTGPRPGAMYLSVYGDRIFGGTVGSSFHDVITSAGLTDAAAAHHTGWPRYGVEDLLAIDPELVITRIGMGQALCRQPGLEALRVCAGDRAGIIELPEELLTSPGLLMLDAAELLHERVHGAAK